MEKIVISWFQEHQRDLPWRKTQDPYCIWVSEIMLQQTQVIRVIDYYERFLQQFPTIQLLATAPQSQLLKAWEGLGYYSRVRNMQQAAQIIMIEHHGVFPQTYSEIIALPGIGTYTAGAILACAFQQAYPAVDGNVLRVMSRMQADFSDISKPATKKMWEQYLAELMTTENPSAFNQGLIEIGALICTPTNPRCDQCPLHSQCQAVIHDYQDELPIKASKKPAKIYYYETFLLTDGDRIAIIENRQKGVLQHLWSLPQYQVENHDENQADITKIVKKNFHSTQEATYFGIYRHVFSHQIWWMRVWLVHVNVLPTPITGAFINQVDFLDYPMANSHRKIVKAFWGEIPLQVAEDIKKYK
ncbi:MAG: A/G-specific adenine glycosylase [Culicoidibacterales bacterium]